MKPDLVLNSVQKQTRFRNRLVGPYRYKKSKVANTNEKNEAKLTQNPENNIISFNDGKRNATVNETKSLLSSSTHQPITQENQMDIPSKALLGNSTASINTGM